MKRSDFETRAKARIEQLARENTAKAFYVEMKRFLPSARVAQMSEMNLQRTMLSECAELIRQTVLPL
jgi:hypothetical protein